MEQHSSDKFSVEMSGKNMVIAYLLWWFLGMLGVHRFYLGRVGTGLTMLSLTALGLITMLVGGFVILGAVGVWWLLDAYFTQAIVGEFNRAHGIAASGVTINRSTQPADHYEQLERLHNLKEKGVISESEYLDQKGRLLSS